MTETEFDVHDVPKVVDVDLMVNGEIVGVSVPADERLVDTLRFRLKVDSVREACGTGVCGSCTVLLEDSVPVSACLVLTAMVDNRSLRTAEGLGSDGRTAALQEAFLDAGAFQCSFCTPGMILAASCIEDEDAIECGLAGNLCRCGTYPRVREAIQAWLDDQRSKTQNSSFSESSTTTHFPDRRAQQA